MDHSSLQYRNARPVFERVMSFYDGEEVACRGPSGPDVEEIPVSRDNLSKELGLALHRIVVEGGVDPHGIVRELKAAGFKFDVEMVLA